MSCTILSIEQIDNRSGGSVHGLNLTVPEDAKETIKPWDERESTEKFADSNVDDQVRESVRLIPLTVG